MGYLNALPLVDTLGNDESLELVRDVPSVLADALRAGGLDIGLIPVIETEPEYEICPDIAIASFGPVASVRLYHRRPLREAGRIALDPSSRSSATLVKILCEHAWRTRPEFTVADGDVGALLDSFDAVLRIGDPCLLESSGPAGSTDLGAAWSEMTDLPFVYAYWAGRPGSMDAETVGRLRSARDAGLERLRGIADGYAENSPWADVEMAYRYLRDNIRYTMGPAEIRGLRLYFELAADLGLVSTRPDLNIVGA